MKDELWCKQAYRLKELAFHILSSSYLMASAKTHITFAPVPLQGLANADRCPPLCPRHAMIHPKSAVGRGLPGRPGNKWFHCPAHSFTMAAIKHAL